MRCPIRSLASLLLAVGGATCSDAPTVAAARRAANTKGRIAVSAVFSKDAAAAYAERATFAALSFDHVRIVLVRPPSDTVKDTTIAFTPGSAPQTVALIVNVTATNEAFNGEIDYTNNGVTVFRATGKFISHPVDEPVTPQEVVAVFVGPGATATKLTVAPKTISLVSPGGASFTASATDANNAAVSGVLVTWSSSDPSVATIDAGTGALSTTGKRGTVTITASAPTTNGTISDNASVAVTLPPASIALVSGGAQTGKAGTALPAPVVVRVLAADGQGVAGITVNFAPPTGGKVGSSSVTTDDNGNASTSLTLGGPAGPQSFAAVAGNFSVSIPATATPADPATIVAVSGGGQQDTVKHPLKAPFVVKVTDAFGNAIPAITVSWARSSGTGALAAASSVTGADGTASVGYTLGATPGAESVTASVSGAATPVTFGATALSSGPSGIAVVSGSGQVGRVGQPLPSPFTVRVTDDAGQGVAGVSVSWSATNGTISPTTTTDAQGSSSNTLTLGSAVGAASVTATIVTVTTTKTVSFSASAQPGIVARLVFRAPPANGSPSIVLAPVQVELRDAAGNLTAAANAVTIALGANPGQATLSGTLTRTSVAGVATFDDLSINVATNGYTLVASSAGVPSVTSATFNIGGAAVASIGFVDGQGVTLTAPSVTVTAGTNPTNLPFIKASDASNHGVANVTLNIVAARGGTPTFTGTATTNTLGLIDLSVLGLQAANLHTAGSYSLTATLANVPGSPLVLPVTVVPAAPAVYALTAPTNIPLVGSATVITASLQDQFGNAVATPTPRSVLWNVTGAGTVTPASSQTNPAGQATTTYTASGTIGQSGTVTATDNSQTPYTGQITLTASGGTATQLSLTTPPPATAPNRSNLGNVVVQVMDASAHPVAVAGVSVIASLIAAPTGGFLAGSATVTTNAAGQAVFSNLSFQGLTGLYTVRFSASGLTPAQANVTTTPGAATTLTKLSGDGQTGVAGAALPTGIRIQLRDADGNATTFPVTTVGFTTQYGSVTPPSVGTDASGQATATWTLPATSGPVTATASATFGSTPVSVVFNATSVAVAGMAFVGTPPSTAASDKPLGTIVVQLVDGQSHPLSAAGVAVTVGVRADPTCSVCSGTPLPEVQGTATVVTDATGRATFSDLILSGPTQIDDLTFDATVGGALPTLVTPAITLTGPPQGAVITATGPRVFSAVFGSPFAGYPIAHVTDAAAQPVAGVTVMFTAGGTGCDTGDSPVSVVTNSSGDAALIPALLPFTPAIPASCTIFAESSGISDIETWSLVLRPPGTVAWTGITSADWFDGTNWTPASPQSTDVVFIPSDVWSVAQLSSTSTTVGGVTMQSNSGGVIDLSLAQLTVNGDFNGGNAGEIFTSTSGSVLLNKAGPGTWTGSIIAPVTVGSPTCTGGTAYTLGISVSVSSLTTNCPIDVNGFFLVVNNDLVVQNSGKIILNQSGSLVQAINMTFQGVSGVGSMTSGSISLRGNLTVNATQSTTPFAPSGSNGLEIAGTGSHTVTWGSGVVPSLAAVAIDAGTGPVTFNTPVGVGIPVSGTLFTGSTGLTIPAGVSMTVSGAATFFSGSVTSILGTMSIGANSIFSPSSIVSGTGTLNVTLPCTKSPNAGVNVGTFNGSACGVSSP